MSDAAHAPEPAATVVPLRNGSGGLEVLMLRRNVTGTFAGMWVFPGGRIDPADAAGVAGVAGVDRELAAARCAAAREALEEAGLVLDPEELVTHSHWTPPEGPGRRFPTWFFLAAVREAVDVVVDGAEIHDHAWVAPAEAIRRRDAGDVSLAPPTWMTLHHLAGFANVDAALARPGEPELFATHIYRAGDQLIATWAGDAAYDGGRLDAPGGRRRLVMDPSGWRAEVDPPLRGGRS